MELILDTADVEAIKEYNSIMRLSGVTTNPKIIGVTGKQPLDAARDVIACLDDDQKFFMQVVSTDYEGIMEEARTINGLREANAYAKIPCTPVGLQCIKDCKDEGLNILGTVVFTAEQGVMAAINGADYLAPYVNRISNYGDGVETTARLVGMLKTYGLPTKVMGASWHNIAQIRDLFDIGIDAITVGPATLKTMITNPTTIDIVDDFAQTWEATYGRKTLV